MQLINPGFGLIFWMTLAFLIVLFVLTKYAWKPILASLKEREDSIEDALQAAEEAKKEMAALQAKNETLLKQAREERDIMLADARKIKEQIIGEAREKANKEASIIVEDAREQINSEKQAALIELKNLIATYSIEIAEKVLRQELSDSKKQQAFVDKLLKETQLN
ncbi:MAG: F0F1 ATP synthase subunit B [Bacteroidetes bacterium]|nr:MAG: F0F1 ATP synthase subunit B [Bacteroidota bacterium]